jgi:hypothetical protein
MWFLGKCPIVPSRLKLVEVSALGRKDPFWVYFYDYVQKHNTCSDIPSSQTFKSYPNDSLKITHNLHTSIKTYKAYKCPISPVIAGNDATRYYGSRRPRVRSWSWYRSPQTERRTAWFCLLYM